MPIFIWMNAKARNYLMRESVRVAQPWGVKATFTDHTSSHEGWLSDKTPSYKNTSQVEPGEITKSTYSINFDLHKGQFQASQMVLVVKNPLANAGDIRDMCSVPGLGRSPGGGHGNPLQYSSLENPKDRGDWWATVHRVPKSQTRLKWLNRHTHKG